MTADEYTTSTPALRSPRSTMSGVAVPTWRRPSNSTVLGGALAHRERNDEQGVEEAMIAYGDGAAGPATVVATDRRIHHRQVPGPEQVQQQLAYRVDDVREAARSARAAGVRTLYDEPRRRRRLRTRSTFYIPRTPVGCWSNWSSRRPPPVRPTRSALPPLTPRYLVGPWGGVSTPTDRPPDPVRPCPPRVCARTGDRPPEQLEYDLRIATANGDATNQRLSEVSAQLQHAEHEVDQLRRAAGRSSPGNRSR